MELARTYALRERVINAMDKPMDSYDLELAWQEPLKMLPRGFGPLMLYREMGLVPVSNTMLHGQDMHARETIFETPDGCTSTDKWVNKLDIGLDDWPFQQKLIVMNKIGVPVQVRFSTGDWNALELDWNDPYSFPLFNTSGEYEIDLELMFPIWPLINRDGVVEDSDPKQIKVATAFWSKVKDKIAEMMNDPGIREKVETELKSDNKAIQTDTPVSDWWTW